MTSNDPGGLVSGVRTGPDLETRLHKLEQKLRYWQLATLWCIGALAVYSCKTSIAQEPADELVFSEGGRTVRIDATGVALTGAAGQRLVLELAGEALQPTLRAAWSRDAKQPELALSADATGAHVRMHRHGETAASSVHLSTAREAQLELRDTVEGHPETRAVLAAGSRPRVHVTDGGKAGATVDGGGTLALVEGEGRGKVELQALGAGGRLAFTSSQDDVILWSDGAGASRLVVRQAGDERVFGW